MRARGPGAYVVDVHYLILGQGDVPDAVALILRQFPVHKLIQGALDDAPGAEQDITRHHHCNDGIGINPAITPSHDQCGNNAHIGQNITPVMHRVGSDGD